MKKLVLFLFVLNITLLQQAAYSFTVRNIINKSSNDATVSYCSSCSYYIEELGKTESIVHIDETIELEENDIENINKPFPTCGYELELNVFKRIWDWKRGTFLRNFLEINIPQKGLTILAVEGIKDGLPALWAQYPNKSGNTPKRVQIVQSTWGGLLSITKSSSKGDIYDLIITSEIPYLELIPINVK